MSEQPGHQPELHFVPLSPEDAALLERHPEHIQNLGHIAMEGVELVGVVAPSPDESTPARLINMSNDPGTRINVEGDFARASENLEKYGSAEDAYAKLQAEASETQEQPDNNEAVARVIEASGVEDSLRGYQRLQDALENGARADMSMLNQAMDDLTRLTSVTNMAAQEGPWDGNYMKNHPALMQQAAQLTENFQMYVRQSMNVSGEKEDAARKFSARMAESSEHLDVDKSRMDSEELRDVAEATQVVAESAKALKTRIVSVAGDNQNVWTAAVRMLDEIAYDSHATVDDVTQTLHRVQASLQQIEESTRRERNFSSQLEEEVSALQRKLEAGE